jgi:acetyltransferase-like isoleucine patch superfamily enzyme
VAIGAGSQLHAGTIMTVDITLGRCVTINRRVDLSHDVRIGDFCSLAPAVSLAGNVQLAEGVEVGIAACCIPGVRIGAASIVGAGAVVTSSIPPNRTAVGVPARLLDLPGTARTDTWRSHSHTTHE